MDLSNDELNLVRQWYNSVKDVTPNYLTDRDHKLMDRINSNHSDKSLTASEMGKIGGASTSDAKAKSSKENGKLGGRPKKTIDTKKLKQEE